MVFSENKKGISNYIFPVLIFSTVFLIAIFPISNYDIFWHLAFGKVQFLEKKILTEEIFSHTRSGVEWYNHTWLSGLVFYLIYTIGGYKGLILFKAFIVSLIALILSYLAKQKGSPYLTIYSLILLMALSSLFRYLERPHLFTYLFIALTYFLTSRFIQDDEGKRALFFLPLISVVWANLHSGVIFGFILLTIFIGGESLKSLYKEQRINILWTTDKLRFLYLILVLFVLASFINPYGPAPYRLLLPHTGSEGLEIAGTSVNYMASMGTEFLPPSFGSFPLFWFSLVLILFLSIIYYKKIDLSELLILFLFIFMAIKHNRAIGMFNIVMVPYLATLSGGFDDETGKMRKSAMWLFAGALLGLAFYYKFMDKEAFGRLAFGLDRNYVPVESSRFIKDRNLEGKMFNTEAIGGYLEWMHYPERKVFYDNRTNIFSSLYEEMHEPGIMEKYDINYGIVMRGQIPPHLFFPKEKWALVFWDKCCSVYVRRNALNAHLIKEYGISYFQPNVDMNEIVASAKSDGNVEQLIKEMEHYLDYVDNLHVFLALARLNKETGKKEQEKAAFLQEGLKKWPNEPLIYLALADLYYRKDKQRLAKKYFKEVVRFGGGNEFIYLNLGYLAYDAGDFKEAVNYFEKSLSKNKDFDQPYYGLGIAYEKSGNRKKAVKYLEEYVKRTTDMKWKRIAERKLRKLRHDEKEGS